MQAKRTSASSKGDSSSQGTDKELNDIAKTLGDNGFGIDHQGATPTGAVYAQQSNE